MFDRLTNASRNRIQKAADAGFVMANGKPPATPMRKHRLPRHMIGSGSVQTLRRGGICPVNR